MDNDSFHFNATNELYFLQSGDEWAISVGKSFHMCIRSHISFYYDGKAPSSIDLITTKTFPELNIYKYFHDVNINIKYFTHDWANKILVFCTSPKNERIFLRKMSELIPDYNRKTRVLKSSYDSLKRSFKWLLYCLWLNNAVLLPVTLSFPKSSRAKNGSEPLFAFYPELMKILRSPYCIHNENIPDIKSHIKSCGFSEFQIRDYAYKIITASTWKRVEDIAISHAYIISKDISTAMSTGRVRFKNNLPVIPVLKLMVSMYPSKCKFNIDDISTFAKSKRMGMAKYSTNTSNVFSNNHSRIIWENLHAEFIVMLTKKGMSKITIRHHKYVFEMLISQLYGNNPLLLIYPKNYKRSTFIGRDLVPAFQEKISFHRGEQQYAILKKLETFFNWVSVNTHDKYVSGFSSPISKYDFPRTPRPKGTSKIIPSTQVFIRLHSFLSTLCEFYWWMVTNKKYQAGQALTKQCYDTESLGMIPIVWIDGKALPVYYIPCKLTGEAISSINGESYYYPIFQTLFALFVEFETGIRTTHICWLSSEHFDEYCKGKWNDYNSLTLLFELKSDAMKMVISSDKVKTYPWEAYVSTRVIRMLKRLKAFTSSLDGDIPERWYNNAVNSQHGKLRSIFHLKEMGKIQGDPLNFDKVRFQFRRMQLFFDLWQNTHYEIWLSNGLLSRYKFYITQLNSFEGMIKSAYNKSINNGHSLKKIIYETFHYSRNYKTNYTPHGIRASVVSQRITLLPPDIIAKYITGHESINALLHYVIIDDDTLMNITDLKYNSLYKNKIKTGHNLEKFKTNVINRRMHTVINENPQVFYDSFSPTSFAKEPSNGSSSHLRIDVISDAAFFTTHICPYNKICPDDVIESTGRYMCGQCYASIKTIAHIPRILAHMRSLNLDLSVLRNHIESAIADGAEPEAISPLDYDYRRLANELAAWVYTYGILKVNFDDKDTRHKYFLANPDQVKMNIMDSPNDKSDLALFILMLDDAHEFVEYHTPNLKAQIISISNKIKMNNACFAKSISQAGDYTLLDELRGLIKSCSHINNLSYAQALKLLLSEQPIPVQIQLE